MALGAVRSLAVFRALQLGDMLCSVPALRALRAGLPHAWITLIGLPSAGVFVERFSHLVDELLPFPGAPGLPEQADSRGELHDFFRSAVARRFDLALQLHGSGCLTNALVGRLGADRMAGFVPSGTIAPPGFIAWPDDLPEPLRYLALTRALGLPDDGPGLEFPLHPGDRAEAASLRHAAGLHEGEYICLHAGARLSSRRWPLENFVRVGQVLASRGWPLVLTGSPDEKALVIDLNRRLRAAGCASSLVHTMAGHTSLGGMAALVAASRLLVSNDTGVSHIAAALRHPSVIIASGSDVRRWAPLDARRHLVLSADAPCRPCAFEVCPYEHQCAWGVEPATVLAAIDKQLEQLTNVTA